MPLAARALIDQHVCPMVDGVKPHVGGPVAPPCSLTVQSELAAQGRGTDRATCIGPPDFIVTGSGSVQVNDLPAARQTDKTMHGGTLLTGAATVEIGGPTVGVTLGNPTAATATCNAMAAGRTSGSSGQSYNNCGCESSRQLINQGTGSTVGEDGLLDESIAHGDADDARNRRSAGGTHPGGRRDILARNGVPSTLEPQGMKSITQGVAEGKGVITSHEASILWGPGNGSGGHAIVVTGLQYDANGNLINVITNDTGLGQCGRSVPAAQFASSLRSGRPVNVTTNPIW